jgi:hypothetical protein
MTNFDRWWNYCRTIKSPDIFVEFSFYAMIAAALERRVWRGSERKPLFTNMYTMFVADPAVGKGLVLEEVEKVLKHFKMSEADLAKDLLYGSVHRAKKAGSKIEHPPLFFVGPSSTTYEMMVYQLASNTRSVWWTDKDNPEQKRLYVHTSACYCLVEMGSLFRKHMDDLVNFLLQAYDCGDYERTTIGRGEDKIKNCCLNLIAGTTPSFLRKIFSADLVDQGFASRGLWIYGEKNRFNRAKPPDFDEVQIAHHTELLKHVKQLAGIYGEIKFTDDAEKFFEHWAETVVPLQRSMLTSDRQKHAMSRKEVITQKLAIAKHYSETLEGPVTKEECEWAVEAMERIMKSSLRCFETEGQNPLALVTQEIKHYIGAHKDGVGTSQILMEFFKDLPNGKKSLDEIINYLIGTAQIKLETNKYKKK